MGKVTNPPLTSGDFEEIEKWEPGRGNRNNRNRSDSVGLDSLASGSWWSQQVRHLTKSSHTTGRTGMMSEDHTG